MSVFLKNNKFYAIDFNNAHIEKSTSESDYNKILSSVKAKYKMAEEESADTLMYKIQKGVDNVRHEVDVYYKKGESLLNDIYYYSGLQYRNANIEEEPSDEL